MSVDVYVRWFLESSVSDVKVVKYLQELSSSLRDDFVHL